MSNKKTVPKTDAKSEKKKLSLKDLNVSVKEKEALKGGAVVDRPDRDRGH